MDINAFVEIQDISKRHNAQTTIPSFCTGWRDSGLYENLFLHLEKILNWQPCQKDGHFAHVHENTNLNWSSYHEHPQISTPMPNVPSHWSKPACLGMWVMRWQFVGNLFACRFTARPCWPKSTWHVALSRLAAGDAATKRRDLGRGQYAAGA